MITQKIVFPAHVYSFAKAGVQGTTLAAMVHETLFDERSSFPALGACAQNRDQIDPARSYGCVATDLFKALAPEHLTHTRHMLDADELVVVTQIPFAKGCTAHSQLGVLCESIHEE